MSVVEATLRLVYAEYGRTLVIRPDEDEGTDALFDKVCEQFENTRIEQDSQGNVHIMAPTGGDSSFQTSHLNWQLFSWATRDGRGTAFDSNALFVLPDRSRLGPDGSWVSNEKLLALSKSERRKFLRIVPEFVIELKSPSDRLPELQEKMQNWLRNGVSLAWLIHPEKQYTLVYRQGISEPEMAQGSSLSGEGAVAGFTLDLKPIWKGLDLA